MNGGVPPTAPKARTGELTPPGARVRARRNNPAVKSWPGGTTPRPRSLFAPRVAAASHDCSPRRESSPVAAPGRGAGGRPGARIQRAIRPARRRAGTAARARNCCGSASANPWASAGRRHHPCRRARSPGGRTTIRPGWCARRGRRQRKASARRMLTATGPGSAPVPAASGRARPGRPAVAGHVEHVEHSPGGQDHVRFRLRGPVPADVGRIGAGLELPGRGDRMRARGRAADPVAGAGPPAGQHTRGPAGRVRALAHRPAHGGVLARRGSDPLPRDLRLVACGASATAQRHLSHAFPLSVLCF